MPRTAPRQHHVREHAVHGRLQLQHNVIPCQCRKSKRRTEEHERFAGGRIRQALLQGAALPSKNQRRERFDDADSFC